ncbi:AI-2E family transporter [candidate division KSB1 bacterium]|nr:AI-2E family transporter [candidate division KSB1 bacterium]
MANPTATNQMVININKRAINVFILLLVCSIIITLLFWIVPAGGMVFPPLIFATLFAFLLNPLVIILERNGFSRTTSVSFIIIFFLLLIGILIVLLYEPVSKEIAQITKMLNNKKSGDAVIKFKKQLQQIERLPLLRGFGIGGNVVDKIETYFMNLIDRTFSIIPNIFSIIIMIVLTPFMTFFLLKDAPRLKKSFIQFIPNRYFEMALILIHKIDDQLGNYIRGQLIVSLIIGALSTLALYFLEVPYFFFIGCIAGLANMIPYFGPITGGAIAAVVNLIDKGQLNAIFGVIMAFAVIRLIDDTIVSPNILARSVEIHPLLVIIVIFIGGEMFGILGLLLCIPVTGIIKMLIKEMIWLFKNYRLSL